MSCYHVYITPRALREVRDLPGHMRQRVRRAIDALAQEPRPPESKTIEMGDDLTVDLRRLRLDRWRIVYVIAESDGLVDVLAVRKRPPYDYGDLGALLMDAD